MATIEIASINYNPATSSFEARVDINAGGCRYRYPCQVAGPLDMDMQQVRARLTRQAAGMSDTGFNLLSVL